MLRKFAVLFAILFGAVSSKNFWECGTSGMKCATNNTCCRSKTGFNGWACFPLVDAVCCSDGINVCPHGTICDLTSKICRKNSLAFLEVNEKEVIENFSLPSFDLSPKDAINFSHGLLDGLKIFDSTYKNTTCVIESERLVSDVSRLVNIVKNFTVDDLAKDLKEILSALQDIVDIVDSQVPSCKQVGIDVKNVLVTVYNKMASEEYLETLASHTLFNLGSIKDTFLKAIENLKADNYFASGRGFGEGIKFLILWDL